MRLIDADKLLTEFKERAEAAKRWQETAKDEEIKIRATATLDFLTEVKLTIEKAPTVEFSKESLDYDYGFISGCEHTRDKYHKLGHWQVIGYHANKYFYCKCSNCQKKTKVYYNMTNPGEFGSLADIRRNVNFCMFCGADMREGQEDET